MPVGRRGRFIIFRLRGGGKPGACPYRLRYRRSPSIGVQACRPNYHQRWTKPAWRRLLPRATAMRSRFRSLLPVDFGMYPQLTRMRCTPVSTLCCCSVSRRCSPPAGRLTIESVPKRLFSYQPGTHGDCTPCFADRGLPLWRPCFTSGSCTWFLHEPQRHSDSKVVILSGPPSPISWLRPRPQRNGATRGHCTRSCDPWLPPAVACSRGSGMQRVISLTNLLKPWHLLRRGRPPMQLQATKAAKPVPGHMAPAAAWKVCAKDHLSGQPSDSTLRRDRTALSMAT